MGATFHKFGGLSPKTMMNQTARSSAMRQTHDDEVTWGNNKSMQIQKGIPGNTLVRASKSKDMGSGLSVTGDCTPFYEFQDKQFTFESARQSQGFVSTRDSRQSYQKNKDESQKANKCFILAGSNQGVFRKISDLQPPSQKGKHINFSQLREQLG